MKMIFHWATSCILLSQLRYSVVRAGHYPLKGGVLGEGNGTELFIAGLMPMTGVWPGGEAMLIAIDIALDIINQREDMLPGYTLKLIYKETKFQVYTGTHALNDLLTSSPPKIMVLGAANSELSQATALVSDLSNLVQVSYASVTPILSDKSTYPRFFRTSQPDTAMNPARIAFFEHFKWTKVATIHQSRTVFDAVVTDLQNRLKGSNITLLTSEVFQNDPKHQIGNLKIQVEGSTKQVSYLLREGNFLLSSGAGLGWHMKHDARIIMAVANKPQALMILCEAFKAGLYGPKYVWFYPGWFDDNWWKEETGICTISQMETAAEGYFTASTVTLNPSDVRTISGLTSTEFMESYNKATNFTTLWAENLMPQAFEAIWAMALALNKTNNDLIDSGSPKRLHDFQYNDTEMASLILSNMRNISFEGIMGPFRFDENHDPLAYISMSRVQSGTKKSIALSLSGNVRENYFKWSDENPLKWQNGRPPVDANIIRLNRLVVSTAAYVAVCILSGLGIILALIFLIINIKYSKTRLIKMSSPYINNVILVGCILFYLTVFEQTAQDSFAISICMVRGFTMLTAFSLVFGALFSKTWRIHKIFAQKTAAKKVIKDSQLILMVLSLLLVNTFVLVLWYCLDPLRLVYYTGVLQAFETNGDILVQDQRVACESEYEYQFTGVLLGIQGILILFGAFLAYETRKVTIPALNDSKHIGFCIYNMLILSAVTVILAFAISDDILLYYVATSIFIILGTTSTMCILFLPKVKKLRDIKVHGEGEDDYTQSAIRQKTQAANPTVSGAPSENSQKEMKDLRQTLALKEKCIEQLQKKLSIANGNRADTGQGSV